MAWVDAAAEAERGVEEAAGGGHPQRQAGRAAAAGGGVKARAGRRGRMCLIASICFWQPRTVGQSSRMKFQN